MKKILTIILGILLCVGIGGLAYSLTKDWNSNTNIEQPNDSNSGSTGDNTPNVDDKDYEDSGNGGGNSGENEEQSKELVKAPNEASLINDDMQMISGASIYLGEEEYEPAIRFTYTLTSELKAQVDANDKQHFAFLVAPVEYFDSVYVCALGCRHEM